MHRLKITLFWPIKIDKFIHFKEISWVKWSFTYRKWLMKCYNDLWCGAVNFHNTVIYLSFSTACLAHLLNNSYFKCFITGFILFLFLFFQILIMMSQGLIFHFKWLSFAVERKHSKSWLWHEAHFNVKFLCWIDYLTSVVIKHDLKGNFCYQNISQNKCVKHMIIWMWRSVCEFYN